MSDMEQNQLTQFATIEHLQFLVIILAMAAVLLVVLLSITFTKIWRMEGQIERLQSEVDRIEYNQSGNRTKDSSKYSYHPRPSLYHRGIY